MTEQQKTDEQHRVVFLLEGHELGGAEKQALAFADYLRREQGCQVRVISVAKVPEGESTQLGAYAERLGLTVEYRSIRAWRTLPTSNWPIWQWPFLWRWADAIRMHYLLKNGSLMLRELADELKADQSDYLLAYCYEQNIMAGQMKAFLSGTGVVWNQRDEGRYVKGEVLEKKSWLACDMVLSNNAHGLKAVESVLGSHSNTQVIPNARLTQDNLRSREAFHREWGVKQGEQVIGMLANLTPFKDHPSLIRAVKKLCDKGLSIKVVLAGRHGEAHGNLVKLVQELGLEQKIIMPGFTGDSAGFWQACDLAVHASMKEGTPNAIMEAMAQGLTVVATDIEAHREILPAWYHTRLVLSLIHI